MLDQGYFAVIDIGSNSVRLVVYSGLERVPSIIFNEKCLCGLGRELGSTGRMADSAVEQAMATLRRFRILCDQMGVAKVEAVATAAVRDAANGQEFVERVASETGFQIRIIAGEEEGYLAGMGVLSGEPLARGIVGDLGGGSLELARIKNGKVSKTISLKIGPLRLISQYGDDQNAIREHVKRELEKAEWLKKAKGEAFYLVGGAWRNIAKLLMREQSVVLPVLHGFSMRRANIVAYTKRLAALPASLIPYGNILQQRRLEVLPQAAIIMHEVLKASGTKQAVVSTYGLREGLIHEHVGDGIRGNDPYLHQCRELASERSRFPEHADLLYQWTRPLFPQSAFTRDGDAHRLHMAVCLLSDIAWRGHPDFRAERAVEIALHGQFVGIDHKGRAFVALALNQTYGAGVERPDIATILPLLSAEEQIEARTLGLSLRLAQRLSGGASEALINSKLTLGRSSVSLHIPEAYRDLVGDVVLKRLKELGPILARKAKVHYNGTIKETDDTPIPSVA